MSRRPRPRRTAMGTMLVRPPARRPDAVPPVLMRPDAESQARLPLREMSPQGLDVAMGLPPGVHPRAYLLGECSVIVTNHGRWILSIAHDSRYPTWDEIAQARYRCLPVDRWFAMYLPPPDDYTNLHRFCFQMHECPEPRIE